ncbi:chemotaxis protein [Geotalea uraniireducens]|uniref:Chemotaxis protein n=1 Tax=Geotalea uraniireducens TaxID=351604 RepID=A0ABN6VZL6_9BACT|nr:methyl-accepting chemotaxis protein [Geotalea uraniireducens]BDV44205.1 chemotaxis protein [Geotalea uraniireducens]
MFKGLKIGSKLGIGFGTVLTLFAVALIVTALLVERVKIGSAQVANETLPHLMHAYELDIATVQIAEIVNDAIVTRNAARVQDAEKPLAVAKEGIARFREMFAREHDERASREVDELATDLDRFHALGKGMVDAYLGGGAAAGDRAMAEFDQARERLTAAIEKLQQSQAAEATATAGGIVAAAGKTLLVLVAACAVALLCSVLIAVSITRAITRPLQYAVNVNDRLAAGDLTVKIEATGRDETGQLLRSMQNMVDNLRDMLSQMIAIATGIASASSQLQATSAQIATGAEEVAAQTVTVATASEEMAATSSDIAANCTLAADASRQTIDSAAAGATVVNETIGGMNVIAAQVRQSAGTVETLGSRSEHIGEIIGTIEDIADQTNLLALNAAIEAARAGEQGRGFAVVADEVRALAERTGKATREIAAMIKAIQQETREAVRTMEVGVQEVERGAASSQKSGLALEEIVRRINEMSLQISQIATAAEEQTATTSEVTNNIQQITEVVHLTARGADETAGAASQLALQAQQLQTLALRFTMA